MRFLTLTLSSWVSSALQIPECETGTKLADCCKVSVSDCVKHLVYNSWHGVMAVIILITREAAWCGNNSYNDSGENDSY